MGRIRFFTLFISRFTRIHGSFWFTTGSIVRGSRLACVRLMSEVDVVAAGGDTIRVLLQELLSFSWFCLILNVVVANEKRTATLG